jgi:hypothetical protein
LNERSADYEARTEVANNSPQAEAVKPAGGGSSFKGSFGNVMSKR